MRVIVDGRNEAVAVPTWILGFGESREFLTMIPKEEQRMSWSSETKQRYSAFSSVQYKKYIGEGGESQI